ncbi:MAG TPA: hypothetical protein PLJ04_02685 [Candidatus Saccharibacteria bacterium]|nr:hypothetical protein [Candidatus Saccharibacteria bacterium]MCB9817675.1 hypothetical protein [Candidatus Nomurabacteria bacterium]HPD98835.1 hypothetical protein [Candidatus Saccharibacteria bacterium]HPR10464.1 hypothetical protein [Candidatus Saccharibacteria bacterium]
MEVPKPITHQIYDTVFDILEENPQGVRWADLLKEVEKRLPDAHPKTVNGCVWKLVEKYPSRVYKPSKGLFCLVKYKS